MKKIFALILFVLLLGAVVSTGFAATETQMTLVPSSTDVVRGQEFTVTVYVSSGKAISSFGFIPYIDDTIFELVSGEVLINDAAISDFSVTDGGAVAFEEARVFSGEAFRYTLRVKEAAPVGKATLSGQAGVSTPTYQVDVKLNTAELSVECNHKVDLLVQAGEGVAYGKCSDCNALETWRYQADGQGVEILEYQGANAYPEIPGYLGGLPVTGIDAGAFSDDAQLVTVTIPATVTNIPANVFAGCNRLETILFGGSQSQWPGVNSQAAVSYNAEIKSVIAVEIADATVYRGDSFSVTVSAYGTNPFTSLGYIPLFDEDVFQMVGGAVLVSDAVMKDFTVIDGGVVLFDEETAYNGQLFQVDLKVKDNAAFGNHVLQGNLAVNRAENAVPAILSGLEMTVACRHDWDWAKVDEQTHTGHCPICDEDKTENHTYVDHICSACGDHELWTYEIANGEVTITDYTGLGGDVYVPAELEGLPVVELDEVFSKCPAVTNIYIPESVLVLFPRHAEFMGCDNLAGIWVDEDNPKYSSDSRGVLFNKDKTELMVAPNTISGEYTIPDSVVKISGYAFYKCKQLTSVIIPDSVIETGFHIFDSCSALKSVRLPLSVEALSWGMFQDCTALETIEIPDNITSFSSNVFSGCTSLIRIILPEGTETIGQLMFENCTSLLSVGIPESVTLVESGAFSGCTSLERVFFGGDETQWEAVDVWGENEPLQTATVYYHSTGVPGDVNGDGEINDDDALYLLRHTLFAKDYPLASDGDVNNDGKVNDRDVIYLLRHTLFEEKYPLYPKKKEE